MYEIYAVIGVVLIVSGLASSSYFAIHTRRSKYKKCYIERLSDGLGTLFLGLFYIYCYSVINGSSENFLSTLNFPDREETYLNVSEEEHINSDIFTTASNTHANITSIFTTSRYDKFDESSSTEEKFNAGLPTQGTLTSEGSYNKPQDKDIAPSSTTDEIHTVTASPLIETLKNDTFKFYQNFFKDIIEHKKSNNSKHSNRPIFFNNQEYRNMRNKTKSRRKREYSGEVHEMFFDPTKQCFNKFFWRHSLLICSFLYSIICLVNNTKLCYKSRHKMRNESSNEKSKFKEESELSSEDSSESNSGLFFVSSNTEIVEKSFTQQDKEISVERQEPNLDIFLAKSSKPVETARNTEPESGMKQNHLNNLQQVMKLLLIWFSPGLCIYTLHMMMENSDLLSLPPLLDIHQNFNLTRANSEMLKLINSPLNVTTAGKTHEINGIVQNVYSIVGRATEHSKFKSGAMNNVMYDIVNFLNRKFNRKENGNDDCSFNTICLKIHSFILFCIMYFASILYSKVLQVKMKLQKNENSNLMKLYILLFGVIWLPSILELFSRIYVFNDKPSTAADTTLAIGNLFVVFNNLNNYLINRNTSKISEHSKS